MQVTKRETRLAIQIDDCSTGGKKRASIRAYVNPKVGAETYAPVKTTGHQCYEVLVRATVRGNRELEVSLRRGNPDDRQSGDTEKCTFLTDT